MGGPPDYYTMLGIMRNATQEEIRRAYLKAVQRLHPDKNVNPGETEMFLDVQQAYEVLMDPKRRAQYDAILPPESKKLPLPVNPVFSLSRNNLIRMNENQLTYVLLEIEADSNQAKNSAPMMNICLVLDVSTSMAGEKLEVVKTTALEIIGKLLPHDIFSLVAFSDRASVLIPASRNIESHHAQQNVQKLHAAGGTEIFQGLSAGVEQVRRYHKSNAVNHVILLTDGQTYGDEQACLNLANEVSQEKIGISAFGIGSGWNDIFLDVLASRTGGNCAYISDPQSIQRMLIKKYENLTQVFVEDVMLEFDVQTGVELTYAFRMQPEANPLPVEGPIHLGAVHRETALVVLLELLIKPEVLKTYDDLLIFDGKLNLNMASATYPFPPYSFRLTCPISTEAATESPPVAIVQALSRLTIYRLQEKARQEVAAGDYELATRHLERMATHLLSQGERSLAKTVLLEADHIQRQKGFSENGEKKVKFGTRALLMSGEKKE
jgi:Ca-activated chloride channel family protein